MKFPILVLDSLQDQFNSTEFSRFSGLEILIKDLSWSILHQKFEIAIKEITTILKENTQILLLVHKDLVESGKLQIIEFLKSKAGTIVDYKDQKVTIIHKKKNIEKKIHEITLVGEISKHSTALKDSSTPKIESLSTPVQALGKSTMNFTRSENANIAKEELVLPHSKIISQKENTGLIFYSHDLLDALDDEDDDLDF